MSYRMGTVRQKIKVSTSLLNLVIQTYGGLVRKAMAEKGERNQADETHPHQHQLGFGMETKVEGSQHYDADTKHSAKPSQDSPAESSAFSCSWLFIQHCRLRQFCRSSSYSAIPESGGAALHFQGATVGHLTCLQRVVAFCSLSS
jgi:hypothetical protein